MKITSSYAVEIKHIDKLFRGTIKLYNSAISYCISVFESFWDELEGLSKFERVSFCESIIHTTASHKALCDFDEKFYKFPTYLRRAVIQASLGYLSSYHSLLDSEVQKPSLQLNHNKMPVFYNDNMFKDDCDGDACHLKVFKDNDWKWVEVKLLHTDIMYIRKHCVGKKMSCPTLEHKNKKWFLRFAFEEDIKLNNTPLAEQRILAVDLGINTDAVCSVMNIDGTVLARKFINFSGEKDQLYHTLNKIKGISQKYGLQNTKRLWRIASFHNQELSRKIAGAIVDYAVEQHCDVIVMEYLNIKGKHKGRGKQKLALWRKRAIQTLVETKAHKSGIRFSRVCAYNTSKFAFDGSGVVIRGRDAGFSSNKLCRFQNGKVYNCDLSASYNIGARYFIREAQKSLPARVWSDIVAKVPECQRRSQCTLHTLLEINKAV